MLPFDKLQGGFANKQTTRNLRFTWCFVVEKRRKNLSPPKLNWNTLANCVDKHLNSQTETMESDLPTYEFGYGKYLIVPLWYASATFGGISGSFGLAMGILAQLRLAKIRTMARPNSPDMPPAEAYQRGTIRYKYKTSFSNC